MERLNSGDEKIVFGMNLRTLSIGLLKCGRAKWLEAEVTRKDFQYCTYSTGQEILYLRALQGHSGRNPIDPSLQEHVLIPDNFFEYTYHIGCAINLHSIKNSGLIPGGQHLGKEIQTEFFTAVNFMNKEHKDPSRVTLFTAPRLARYKQQTWKRHQDTVYRVEKQLAERKGLKFYQTRSNAIIFSDTLPAYCIPKVVVMESGEIIYEKVCMSPRPPPQISLKHHWMNEWVQKLLDNQKEKLLDKQKVPNQPNQTQIQIMIERRDPLFAQKTRPFLRKSIHVFLVTARTPICM